MSSPQLSGQLFVVARVLLMWPSATSGSESFPLGHLLASSPALSLCPHLPPPPAFLPTAPALTCKIDQKDRQLVRASGSNAREGEFYLAGSLSNRLQVMGPECVSDDEVTPGLSGLKGLFGEVAATVDTGHGLAWVAPPTRPVSRAQCSAPQSSVHILFLSCLLRF